MTFQFLVSSLSGWPDVPVLRAAARAGATAILNLEGVSATQARTSLNALVLNKPGRIGVRVDDAAKLDSVGDLVPAIDVVVAVGGFPGAVDAIDRLRGPSRALLLECTNAGQARMGAELGVDGVIAKGHESGGSVGDETTFVLVQRVLEETDLPVFAHGGIGRHTVGACFAAGCAGVILDAQLALARESTLPEGVKTVLRRMGGDETICLGSELDARYRVYRRPGFAAVDELQSLEIELASHDVVAGDVRRRWYKAIESSINWTGVGTPLWPLGQDAVSAATLASRFRSVGGILSGLSVSLADHVRAARETRSLDRGAPLAVAHGTEYPILQGPMTRVSDTAAFADAVAAAGGLPFLALALMRAPQVRSLLNATQALLGNRPWGVGILGFVPNDLREEQLRVVEEFSPPFAIIAGGRPDQAAKLEKHGVKSYLHVPSPSLLQMFLNDGARRFIFEGRECGGHVGPRTSFVLWESMIDTLLEAIERGIPAHELHIVFAGGIHDARSAGMVATIGAPLAKLGVRIGVLMGTAYLFTTEAVATGAIVETFQEEAMKCSRTVLLETGPGHATRCADTPFFELFRETRRRLVEQRESPDDVRIKLETLNLGRLRVASKGISRANDAGGEPPTFVTFDRDRQRAEGLYMIGQVAALRGTTCRIADLHRNVSVEGTARLDGLPETDAEGQSDSLASALACEIAIVGAGCILPNASDAHSLWTRILGKDDAIREIPRDRFDTARYFDADRKAQDKIYSKWGGFLPEVPFDPVKHGIPPASVPSIDPFQLLTLEVVHQALQDAGYDDRPFDRERTSVILGASGGVGDLGFRYGIRAGLPMYLDPVPDEALTRLPVWTEDSFAGVLLNVAAGRVANRLNLGGLNFTVDAACASSLAAVYVAARELESRSSDMVIVGGIDTVNSPFGFLCFSSAQALSPTGRCRTFDENADGIAISEGLTALVLKRVADAERDGDRIYGVIRAVAGSSDGRGRGLTAPRPEGQMRVLQRAYAAAGFSPATVGLVEAHGTGTVAGDAAEVTALSKVFSAAGAAPASCALGSIKSMIGHTKSAAGVTGLLKVALALHHKVLPPTLHVTRPNARLREGDTPFFVNTETQPWVAPLDTAQPRRAAVSSFGFGGTNFHVVMEEHDRNSPGALPETSPAEEWRAEVAFWTSPSAQHLLASLQQLEERLSRAPDASLRSVAAAVCRGGSATGQHPFKLAIVASSIDDLRDKMREVCRALTAGKTRLAESRGIFLDEVREPAGKVAFLFPGQGSQYPGMHRDLSVAFPDLRQALEAADQVTRQDRPRRLSSYVWPPAAFSSEQTEQQQRELTDTAIAQPALGGVELGVCELLRRIGIVPDMTAGHSYGEYVALSVAGAFPPDTLIALSAARGNAIKTATGDHPGTMAAVVGTPERILEALGDARNVWIANINSPKQTVLGGSVEAIEEAVAKLSAAGLSARPIAVSCAFHSPLVEPAERAMADVLARTEIHEPRIPVFSNTLAAPYPVEPDEIRRILSAHIAAPVRFADQLHAMYAEGARIFIEVGPRGVLSNFVRQTLSPHKPLTLTLDSPERHGVTQLLHVVAQLLVAGVSIDFEELWRGRRVGTIQLAKLAAAEPLPKHVWLVNGGRARKQGETPVTLPATSTSPRSTPAVSANGPAAMPKPIVPPAAKPASPTEPVKLPQTNRLAAPRDGVMSDTTNGTSHVMTAGANDVLRQFQQLMSQFLQTQALVMTAYLQGAPAAGLAAPGAIAQAPLRPMPRPIALDQQNVSMVETAVLPSAAALPHPVIETAPSHTPAPAAAAAVPVVAPSVAAAAVAEAQSPVSIAGAQTAAVRVHATSAAVSPSDILSQLLVIVSERTGYPEDMLDIDSNIEADLGIDSIKRMEILTAFVQTHAGAHRGAFQGAMEKLTGIKTIRETANVLAEILMGQTEAAVA
jgi:acyl transferase domain-containing protein